MLVKARNGEIVIESKFIMGLIYTEYASGIKTDSDGNAYSYNIPVIKVVLSSRNRFEDGIIELYYGDKNSAKTDISLYYDGIKNKTQFLFSDMLKDEAEMILSCKAIIENLDKNNNEKSEEITQEPIKKHKFTDFLINLIK